MQETDLKDAFCHLMNAVTLILYDGKIPSVKTTTSQCEYPFSGKHIASEMLDAIEKGMFGIAHDAFERGTKLPDYAGCADGEIFLRLVDDHADIPAAIDLAERILSYRRETSSASTLLSTTNSCDWDIYDFMFKFRRRDKKERLKLIDLFYYTVRFGMHGPNVSASVLFLHAPECAMDTFIRLILRGVIQLIPHKMRLGLDEAGERATNILNSVYLDFLGRQPTYIPADVIVHHVFPFMEV